MNHNDHVLNVLSISMNALLYDYISIIKAILDIIFNDSIKFTNIYC